MLPNARVSGRNPLSPVRTFGLLALVAWGACSAAAPGRAQADTATLQASQDNTLYETAAGTLSNGIGPTMFAGRTAQAANSIRRALVRFDVAAAIPAGSTIDGATLTLNMSQTAAGQVNVTLHRVLAGWGEGASHAGDSGGPGAPSAPGDATWRHRFFNATFWTAPGGDHSVAASATTSVDAIGPYTWGSTAAMVADVQDWLVAPSVNFGWLLRGGENLPQTVKRFDTREHATPEVRPFLNVTFTPPGTPALPATWGRIKGQYR